jgi:hypothetical protein
LSLFDREPATVDVAKLSSVRGRLSYKVIRIIHSTAHGGCSHEQPGGVSSGVDVQPAIILLADLCDCTATESALDSSTLVVAWLTMHA